MSKNVAAINIATREQYGESQYLSKYSNQLVELMKPVALQANKDLYNEEYQMIVQQAEAMVENNELDRDHMQEYINKAFELYRNPVGTLQSGSVGDKIAVIRTMQEGGTDSPSRYLSAIRDVNKEAYSSGTSIEKNIRGNAWGLFNFRDQNFNNSAKVEEDIKKSEIKSEKTLTDIYNKYIENANDFNTRQQQWDTWFENSTEYLGDIKSMLGSGLTSVVTTLLAGIGTYFGGKFLNSLASGKLGTWLSSVATKFGPLATGIMDVGGGIAIGLTAANLIKSAIEGAIDKTNEENINTAETQLKGTNLEGNKAASTLKGLAITQDSNNNNFANRYGAQWNKTTRWIGVGTLGWTRDLKTINQDDWRYFQESNIVHKGDEKSKMAYNLAWALLLKSAGRDADVPELSDVMSNVENISAIMNEYGWTKEYLNRVVNDDTFDYKPNKTKDEDQEFIDWEKLNIPNIHRQGLDSVPYDDYPALLHQGEAVLTASTANEMRNLLDEFRDNRQASADLDAIIQNQTIALCNKMDEIINVMATAQSGRMFDTTSLEKANLLAKMNSSMKHIRSTKDALN